MSSEVAEVVSENNQHDAAEAKGKKSLGKKLTALERTTQEGEALLKEMGYKEDGEDQGRRRTRSGAKPSAVASPPPAKKEKKTPKKTPKATPGTGRRGRPPKKTVNDSSTENEDSEMKEEEKAEVSSTEEPKSDTKPTEEAAKEEKKEEKEAEKEAKKENNDVAAVIEPVKEKENLSDKEESKASD